MMTTFDEIKKSPELYENKAVEIRGFLYRDSEGQFFLSDVPNLHSCCILKANHLLLHGEFPEALPKQVTVIQGILKPHSLEEAKIITHTTFPYGLLLFLIVPFMLLKKRFSPDLRINRNPRS